MLPNALPTFAGIPPLDEIPYFTEDRGDPGSVERLLTR